MLEPTVSVLMSTYNGEKYLEAQIDSILAQDGVKVQLVVRDDGSTDGTCNLLDAYKAKGLLTWYSGPNLGPARSFMQLLLDAPAADFYAFADQDDFWQPEKLRVAVEALQANSASNRPALYFSQTQLTDADLHPIPSVIIHPRLTFGESLVYEFVGGCTIVMNRTLRDVLAPYRPDYLGMHDVWVYSVCLAIGGYVHFDPTPHILYRQHGANTIGQGYSLLHEMKRRWQRFSSSEHSRLRRARDIQKGFASLIKGDEAALLKRFVEAGASFSSRLALLFDERYKPANSTTWWFFKLNVLLGTV